MTDEQLSALLRLKRHEQPPAGYFDDLLRSVHRRQREELLRRPLWQIMLDRVQALFTMPAMGPLAYGGAFAALMVAGVATINSVVPQGSANLAEQGLGQPVAGQLAQAAPHYALRLQPGSEAVALVSEQLTLAHPEPVTRTPRYVIDARPVSYDSMPSF